MWNGVSSQKSQPFLFLPRLYIVEFKKKQRLQRLIFVANFI